MQSYDSVRSSTAHLSARLISDSVMDHLEYMLRDSDVGFNVGGEGITCEFGGDDKGDTHTQQPGTPQTTKQPTDTDICTTLSWIAEEYEGQRIEVVLETKAHALVGESLKSGEDFVSAWSGSYTVPFPGTGDAGARCGMYNPVLESDNNEDTTVPKHLANGATNLDQLNYSCNWNKLAFGSALTDRVALPLYYAQLNSGNTLNFVNPFKDGSANNFALRLRTPCLPCVYEEEEVETGKNRLCTRGDDPTVCIDDDRYKLTATPFPGEIVVQWQLSGKCDTEGVGTLQDCSMIADSGYASAIFEANINDDRDSVILWNSTTGQNISTFPYDPASFLGTPDFPAFLSTLSEPVLTLFLSSSLTYSDGQGRTGNIPYLEYQLITDYPVSNQATLMNVEVTVEGNTYKRTLERRVKTPLIDFALQN